MNNNSHEKLQLYNPISMQHPDGQTYIDRNRSDCSGQQAKRVTDNVCWVSLDKMTCLNCIVGMDA